MKVEGRARVGYLGHLPFRDGPLEKLWVGEGEGEGEGEGNFLAEGIFFAIKFLV